MIIDWTNMGNYLNLYSIEPSNEYYLISFTFPRWQVIVDE